MFMTMMMITEIGVHDTLLSYSQIQHKPYNVVFHNYVTYESYKNRRYQVGMVTQKLFRPYCKHKLDTILRLLHIYMTIIHQAKNTYIIQDCIRY